MSRGALWGVILAGGDGHAYVAQAAAIGRGPDRTVLLGIAPDRPAPGYGWIEPWTGRPDSGDTEDIHTVPRSRPACDLLPATPVAGAPLRNGLPQRDRSRRVPAATIPRYLNGLGGPESRGHAANRHPPPAAHGRFGSR